MEHLVNQMWLVESGTIHYSAVLLSLDVILPAVVIWACAAITYASKHVTISRFSLQSYIEAAT